MITEVLFIIVESWKQSKCYQVKFFVYIINQNFCLYHKSIMIYLCNGKVKVMQSCLTLWDPWTIQSMEFSRPEGIFPTQGSNPGLPYCRRILYQLSHKGSPRMLEWVAYPFSRGYSWPRNRTRVSCIAGRFFTNWAIREAYAMEHYNKEKADYQ